MSWLFTSMAEDLKHGTTVKQIQVVSEEDLNPGPPDYKSSALTTRPCRLLKLYY